MENASNIDHNSLQSQALPTQNLLVGEGRGSPSPTGLDGLDGAKLEYPPGLLFTPPRTDPLHRRLAAQRKGDDGTDSVQRNNGPVTGNQDWNDVESPLPPRLLVAHSRTSSEPDKAENSNTGSASQEQPTSVKIAVSEFNRGDSIPNPSPQSQTHSLPMSTVAPGNRQDEPDAGVSSYIARMRARGHKRSSSAPVPYQPPPMPPTVELKTEGEGGSEASQRREKTVRPTRLQSCLPSCLYAWLYSSRPAFSRLQHPKIIFTSYGTYIWESLRTLSYTECPSLSTHYKRNMLSAEYYNVCMNGCPSLSST